MRRRYWPDISKRTHISRLGSTNHFMHTGLLLTSATNNLINCVAASRGCDRHLGIAKLIYFLFSMYTFTSY